MIRLAVALVALACFTSVARADNPSEDGPHPVRAVKKDVKVAGRKTFVDVRLPKDVSGPRPVVLICHGWAASIYNYEKIANHLASRGMVAVLFQQPNRWSSDTPGWAAQIHEALDALERFDEDSGSGLAGALDMTNVGLVGHSFGGAAVIWEAASDGRVKCVVGLAPVNQSHREHLIANAGLVTAPLLVVAGDSDWLATNHTYTRPIYDAAKRSSHREYVQVKGGDHNFYTSTNDRSKLASRYYTAFLEHFLGVKDDAGGWTDGTAAAQDAKAKKLSDSAAAAAESAKKPDATPGVVGALGAPGAATDER